MSELQKHCDASKVDSKRKTFVNSDNEIISCRYWCEDVANPKALVMICHGVGEHCLYYDHMAALLKPIGCYVFAHDHVGHGESTGDRVHVDNFEVYVKDIFQHFDTVAEKFKALPKFLIGHSMGGAVAAIVAIKRPDYLNGLILIAPGIIPDPATATPTMMFFVRIIAKLFPQAPLVPLHDDYVCRDESVLLALNTAYRFLLAFVFVGARMEQVRRYKADKLTYHGRFKARWGVSYMDWMKWLGENMHRITCPCLIMHGTEDKLCHPDGSRLLYEKSSSTDKTLKIYPGFYHQLHNEPGNDGKSVRDCIVNWIGSRI